ncbi:MAG: methyltransferase domain-containing protein [Flavobacteriales bacterium]|nr:methyltransferase domain-containing protein [Flavobacteriales bacterium]
MTATSKVLSPITGDSFCIIEEEFDSKEIIDLYLTNLNIDVNRFFLNIPLINIYRCQETGYRFYYPFEAVGDGLFYEQLQKRGQKYGSGYYREGTFDHKFSLEHIEEGDKVLEIGCGEGVYMKLLADQKNIISTGLELNNYTIKKCINEGLDVYNMLIEDFAVTAKSSFDKVCTFQVLEHVYSIKSFIESSLKVLKKGGLLIISVPNCEPYRMRHDKFSTLNLPPHHMGLWNKEIFQNLVKIFPIEIIEVKYSKPQSIRGDAYFRMKRWLNIKSLSFENQTFVEKIKMILLLPLAIFFAIFDKFNGDINGGQICVVFKKK